MARGKVITTRLRTGDPNGICTVFISNKICEMIVFPKSEFEMVSKMEESSRPALYILLGEDENGSAQAYIGESINGVKRIARLCAGQLCRYRRGARTLKYLLSIYWHLCFDVKH